MPAPLRSGSTAPAEPIQASAMLPLYHRLYTAMRQQLLEGRHPAGQALPGELRLAKQYGVSRVTVRRALAQLAAEHLVVRSRARGTFPVPGAHVPATRANISGLLSDLLAVGHGTGARLLEYGMVSAPPEVAVKLDGSVDALRIVRLRTIGADPVALYTHWLPPRSATVMNRRRMGALPVLTVLEGAGHVAARADQVLTAQSADHETSGLLGVKLGTALICLKRLSRDAQGMVLEYHEALYRPDQFEYRLELTRERNGAAPGWASTRSA